MDTVAELLNAEGLFEDVGSAPREHAIHSVTPFLKATFPDTPVAMITTATHSKRADWDAAVAVIAKLAGPDSLIVQSTDYSHFLPRDIAVQRDIETIGVIAANDSRLVSSLTQPSHTDSKASQYIQMRLQEMLHGSAPVIVAHRDAHDYVVMDGTNGPTTTYIVTLYSDDPSGLSALTWDDQERLVFGGDVFLDRGWRSAVAEGSAMDPIISDLAKRRGQGVFIINLEGVILDERPAGSNPIQHLMLEPAVVPMLRRLGVDAANLANNHSHDFGTLGLSETRKALDENQIIALSHDRLSEFSGIGFVPLSFRRGYFADHPVIRQVAQLDAICEVASTKPLVVLAHWGADYTNEAGLFELDVLEALANCGVTAVIGAHSHHASTNVTLHGGGRLQAVFSMGNLLFDQTGDDVSGALVELRRFSKGTIAMRLIPIPNYFQMFKAMD